jgi:hypothetical protein
MNFVWRCIKKARFDPHARKSINRGVFEVYGIKMNPILLLGRVSLKYW